MISDIHVDMSRVPEESVEDTLAAIMKEEKLDALLIAGDISNDYQLSLQIIDKLQVETKCKLFFVPGNHDLWNKEHPDMLHTQEIYEALMNHPSCLVNSPVELNEDYVLIGDVGWYDYSFGSRAYHRDAYLTGYKNERQWMDKKYVNWHVSDEEKTEEFYQKLKDQMQKYPNKKIVFVTHMITDSTVCVSEERKGWDYFNGFLGSRRFADLWNEQVTYVVMGHVHFRKIWTDEKRTYICPCLNYRSQWLDEEKSVYVNIKEALCIVEL